MTSDELSHIDADGNARMVDVSSKDVSQRTAVAKGEVRMLPATLEQIRSGNLKKGDVLTVAKVAGIGAAKRTSELIPFCHPLPLDHIEIDFELDKELPGIYITAA
ncbi:MAG: cyclic pyranopterin monophosphate synthase MoaC, partial [Anaerolineae bacterium]|nr:cyclic pyranopterin monophosphate synthase MoaC [Anaerolineae bacterium]